MRLLLALLFSISFTGLAAAAALTPEEAVAYLLVGIQVGKHSEVAGVGFDWQENTPGIFSGEGKSDSHTVKLSFGVSRTSDCVYDIATHVEADTGAPFDAKGTYDFSKITAMALTAPDTAQITGDNFCTSNAEGICDAKVDMAVPTDQPTFDGVYNDFRKNVCK